MGLQFGILGRLWPSNLESQESFGHPSLSFFEFGVFLGYVLEVLGGHFGVLRTSKIMVFVWEVLQNPPFSKSCEEVVFRRRKSQELKRLRAFLGPQIGGQRPPWTPIWMPEAFAGPKFGGRGPSLDPKLEAKGSLGPQIGGPKLPMTPIMRPRVFLGPKI